MINNERLLSTFLDYVRIDSESKQEKEFARRVISDLKAMGCEVYVDDTMDKTGSDTGNVYATLPGTAPGEPILLCAHMDTVVPGVGVEPVVEDGGFCKEFVEGEKRNLISAIESQLNDKRAYAATRLMEIMCKADTFGIPRTGTHEQVAAIDAVTLYVHYQKLLRESPVEVFYVGSGDGQLVAEKIRTLFASIDRQPMVLPEHTHFCDGGKEDVTQTMEISQAKLCMGFTSPITVDDRQFYALQLFNLIFGMGMTSKLFMTIREKLSLCYNIGSTYYGAKGIITVSAGIDCDKYDQVRQEVLHQLDECKQGNISEQELDNARQALLSSLKGIYDSPASIESYESVMAIGNTLRPVEEYRRCAQEVTLQQVIDAAKTVELHTTYFLKGVEA